MIDKVKVASLVIQHGRPFARGWYDDGDAETGPMGGTVHGIRWGQLVLEETRNGSLFLYRTGTDDPMGIYPVRWWEGIYSSMRGTKDPAIREILDEFHRKKVD